VDIYVLVAATHVYVVVVVRACIDLEYFLTGWIDAFANGKIIIIIGGIDL
jgi:hypothetical protein